MITLDILRNVRENFKHKGLFINDDTFCRGAYIFLVVWTEIMLIHVFYPWVWVFSFDYWLVLELMPGIGRQKWYLYFIFEAEFQFWSVAGDRFVLSLNLSFHFRFRVSEEEKQIRVFYLSIWVFSFDQFFHLWIFQFWSWAGFRINAGYQKKKKWFVYFIFQSEFSVLINFLSLNLSVLIMSRF